MLFADRRDAGRRLSHALTRTYEDPVVLGLPRGGVPVAHEVARALGAPLDVLVVRKLGVPGHPELAMGAIGEGGVRILNDRVVARSGVTDDDIQDVARAEQAVLDQRLRRYRGDRPAVDVNGRTVIVVDDGIATGSTARAALQVVARRGPRQVVLAVPVAPARSARELQEVADQVVCAETPEPFGAIGQFYRDFSQTSDDEVSRLLPAADRGGATPSGQPPDGPVEVAIGEVRLPGELTVPSAVTGLVVFAHGSGSSHRSPRNRAVAQELNQAGLATLLIDLLTVEEGRDRANVFDVPLLAARLRGAADWLHGQSGPGDLPVGYFGASTGAAAALVAAAEAPGRVSAVVSRGGRPDLADAALEKVDAPTLLIVGSRDPDVLRLNLEAERRLSGTTRLHVVDGATHLFEEPGALQEVSEQAADWFTSHLRP